MKYFVAIYLLTNLMIPGESTQCVKEDFSVPSVNYEIFSPHIIQQLKVPSAKPLNFQEFHHRNIQRKILERSA